MKTWLSTRLTCVACALVLTLPGASAVRAETDWTLAHEADGMTIHTRTAEGESIREFRAVTTFAAPLDVVTAVFEDVGRFPEWYDRCAEARRLGGDRDSGVIYVRADLPFPVADRDVAFRNTRTRSPDGVIYVGEAEDGLAPAVDGLVRMPEMRSVWTFRSVDASRTEVTFQQRANPGGAIPSWLANAMVTSMPKNSLSALAKLVSDSPRGESD